MLSAFTAIAISHEQVANLIANSTDTSGKLDVGSAQSLFCKHPELGDLIVFENLAGPSIVAIDRSHAHKITDKLLPN
ncbi:MAG: hypothetical protein M3O74_13990 [Pseudomonadota bacterium]|nr:hypothetical protein [Pseudomonadota bacterium]